MEIELLWTEKKKWIVAAFFHIFFLGGWGEVGWGRGMH